MNSRSKYVSECGCLCEDETPLGEIHADSAQQPDDVKSFVDGRSTSEQAALRRAAEILRESRSPLIYGMGASSVQTVRAAVHLAEAVRGMIDPVSTTFSRSWRLAMQSRGCPTLTLGELRDRADLVVLWGTDPARTHPRFVERFLSARLLIGELPRQIARVAFTPDSADKSALVIAENSAWEAVRGLRMRWRKYSAGQIPVTVAASPLDRLSDLLFRSQYAVFCFDLPTLPLAEARQVCEEFILLAGELNEGRRCSLLPMLSTRTAETVLAWQTGFPAAISFRQGVPQHDSFRWHAEAVLAESAADCVVLVESGAEQLSPVARERLQGLPVIQIVSDQPAPGLSPVVRWVLPGRHMQDAGTRYRMDGAPIGGRQTGLGQISVADILTSIRERLPLNAQIP